MGLRQVPYCPTEVGEGANTLRPRFDSTHLGHFVGINWARSTCFDVFRGVSRSRQTSCEMDVSANTPWWAGGPDSPSQGGNTGSNPVGTAWHHRWSEG